MQVGNNMDLNEMLKIGVKKQASDLHLSPGQHPIMRIDGDLIFLTEFPTLTSEDIEKELYGILTEAQRSIFKKKLEYDFSHSVPNLARFRINAFHQAAGVAAAFRTIPESIPTLDQFEMPKIFKQLVSLPNGLILVTGPTGSGKSTTLAAMIDEINRMQSCHIITIEDPIEFIHMSKRSLVNQREIHRDTRHFKAALRSALREDPDVILVGELRDLETIRLALTAAETGHLVMATLHTSSAPRAISRIVDVFPAEEKNIIRNMLSESLQAVISQTLINKIDGGRVPAFEIMLGTSAIRNLIREDKIAQMYNSIQMSSAVGMCTIDQYLSRLVEKQIINKASAKEYSLNKSIFT
jgi:twitching motility protein PilT